MTRLERGKDFLKKHVCSVIDSLSAKETFDFFMSIGVNREFTEALKDKLQKGVKESEDFYACHEEEGRRKCKYLDDPINDMYGCGIKDCIEMAEGFYSEEVEDKPIFVNMMSDEELDKFLSAVARTELYEEIEDYKDQDKARLKSQLIPYPRYLKAIKSTLLALGYEEEWVLNKVAKALNDKYLKN